ncbi:MAG: hybrid sensor histidine kinase/response regulator [Chloroflexia bacterium]|nr:hybrid sensor histidine kinase/response regulator [Chloroflexia bacterium]
MSELNLSAFYGQFRDETRENLDILEQGLTELEAQPDNVDLLDQMLRAVHTTKGSAKIMGFAQINRLAHAMEDVLSAMRKGDLEMRPAVGTVLLEASGAIRTLTDALGDKGPVQVDMQTLLQHLGQVLGQSPEELESGPEQDHPASTAPMVTMSSPSQARAWETMRVDMARIDQLAGHVGEALSLQNRVRQLESPLQELSTLHQQIAQGLEKIKGMLATPRRLRSRQVEQVRQTLESLEAAANQQQQRLQSFVRSRLALQERFDLALSELHQEALGIRMQPIGTIFERFPGVVRRLAGECGVQVDMEIAGGEVELDRRVLDLLRDPLIHMVRNAIDHGIEPPQERQARGKSPRGRIRLAALQQGRRVLVRVEDDGQGIDLERVRQSAIEQGLLSEAQAQDMPLEALQPLLFRAGFSTRQETTDMSGRGVGLNVVQTAIRQLNGLVQIDSRPGQGTTFILDVPLTLATIRVLLVESAGQTIAIPTTAVRSLARIQPQQLLSIQGQPALRWQDQALPLRSLAETVGLGTRSSQPELAPAIIVGRNGQQVALLVDRVLDESEVVVQPLGRILEQSPSFSTATLLGNDQVVPILDLVEVLSQGPGPAPAPGPTGIEASPRREIPHILLVEDTITTRELERSILEAAGYRVSTAFDGLNALEKLEQAHFQLVITDIEMPRMDGFELTARIRQDPRWQKLPVMIISAYEDPASRRRGLQTGAQAYISKGRFDQSNLLDMVEQLLGETTVER